MKVEEETNDRRRLRVENGKKSVNWMCLRTHFSHKLSTDICLFCVYIVYVRRGRSSFFIEPTDASVLFPLCHSNSWAWGLIIYLCSHFFSFFFIYSCHPLWIPFAVTSLNCSRKRIYLLCRAMHRPRIQMLVPRSVKMMFIEVLRSGWTFEYYSM